MTLPKLREEPGWLGWFTREQADGALPNGTRIRKIKSEPLDSQPDGAPGTVLGSFAVDPEHERVRYCYFVEWDAVPRLAVGLVDYRLAQEDQQP